eukprot:CAMPEP_0171085734 /NCGR_PEP_ID=MMETSP0766_2-20121228/19115_1 /TAXON_ID=439317 /ORGANISM="Gambierdiscus australes, Strain CAWD 149" /LENGTH=53 /DNA_ID=CAMNT_0011543325 /DNA_START=259 /DNA_END=420 /DNA_ORIENTATION=-
MCAADSVAAQYTCSLKLCELALHQAKQASALSFHAMKSVQFSGPSTAWFTATL